MEEDDSGIQRSKLERRNSQDQTEMCCVCLSTPNLKDLAQKTLHQMLESDLHVERTVSQEDVQTLDKNASVQFLQN